jgi:hypothetical protein
VKLVLGEDARGISNEDDQEVERLRREVNLDSVARELALRFIQQERAESDGQHFPLISLCFPLARP